MVLLKTVLIILLVYYGLKILVKWYGPKLFNYAARKTEEKFKERFEEFTQQIPDEEQQFGDFSVSTKKSQKKTSNEPVGEYIEFEELD